MIKIKQNLIILILIATFGCLGQKSEKIDTKTAKIGKMQNKKEIVYGLSVQIDMPFELYVNDIAVAKEYSKARKIMGIDLNPYLLKNGKYPVKIKLLPLEDKGEMVVRPSDVATSFVKFMKYEIQREPMMGRAKNFEMIQQLPLPQIDSNVPILETEWEIDVTELPYELDGWRNSQDLSEIDKDSLEHEVVKYYEFLRELLNHGNSSEYEKLNEKRYKETQIFNYTTKADFAKTKQKNKNTIENLDKNNMLPIQNYELFIYGEGRLLRLERVDQDFKSWSVLIRETEETYGDTGVLLHKPVYSDSFEIIRK